VRKGVRQTKFIEWMEANKKYPAARELTYGDFQPNLCGMMHKKCGKSVKQSFQ
jgi:hypothetical protein